MSTSGQTCEASGTRRGFLESTTVAKGFNVIMSATSTSARTERALVAGVGRWALGFISGLARGGPVRETADQGAPEAMRIAAVVHLGVALVVGGAATAVALLFFVLPPAVYVALFAVITAVLVTFGIRALRRLRVVTGRGYLFWAGIAWGLLVASGAYLTQLTGFVPHLWLGWTLGVLVLGVLGAGAVQTAFSGVLAALWVGAAALIGESFLPGFAILVVLLVFPMLARPSRLVGAAAAILALALAVAYALRLLPQTPAGPLAIVTVVVTCGLLRIYAARLPLDALTSAPPRGCPSYGIRAVVNTLGLVALVVLPLPPVLQALRTQLADVGSGARAGMLLPLGVLVVAVALPGKLRRGSWPAIVVWVTGSVLLTAALILPAPTPTVARAALAVLLAGFGLWWSWRGRASAERPDRTWVALGWLGLAVLLVAVGLPWFVAAVLLVAFGGYVIVLARRLWDSDRPGFAVPFGVGALPADSALQLPAPPGEPGATR
jgi:hypothetical protein